MMQRGWLVTLVLVIATALGLTTACGSDAAVAKGGNGTLRLTGKVSSALHYSHSSLTIHVVGTRSVPATTPPTTAEFDMTPVGEGSEFTTTQDLAPGTWSFTATATSSEPGAPTEPVYTTIGAGLTGVEIVAGETTSGLTLYLYDIATAFSNRQPRVGFVERQGESALAPNASLTLAATIGDNDFPGETLDFDWSITGESEGGTLTEQPADAVDTANKTQRSSATFSASAPGIYEVTLIATDSKQAKAGVVFQVSVQNGAAQFTAVLRHYPQVDQLYPSYGDDVPFALGSRGGDTVDLVVVASDVDGNLASATWTSTCGTFSTSSAAFSGNTLTTSFTYNGDAVENDECEVIVTVADSTTGTPLTNTGHLFLQVEAFTE